MARIIQCDATGPTMIEVGKIDLPNARGGSKAIRPD